jgi:RNA polymerase-binding transcription factor DksA
MMTRPVIEAHRQSLLALAARYRGGVSKLRGESFHGLGGESGGGISDVPTHAADLGNANYEEEMNLTLLEAQEQLLEECDAALARIRKGAFGVCEECHRPIAQGRLRACPYARHCVTCARKLESQVAC